MNSCRNDAFEWGLHDCCLFASDAIFVMTGVDPASELRGYTTKRGAVDALKAFAGGGLEPTMAKIADTLGAAEVPPAFARRGDAVYLRQQSGMGSFGIAWGETAAVCGWPGGVLHLPMTLAVRAWRVG